MADQRDTEREGFLLGSFFTGAHVHSAQGDVEYVGDTGVHLVRPPVHVLSSLLLVQFQFPEEKENRSVKVS